MTVTATPATVRENKTAVAERTAARLAARYMSQRRRAARRNGYHGPLTREELAARCARAGH